MSMLRPMVYASSLLSLIASPALGQPHLCTTEQGPTQGVGACEVTDGDLRLCRGAPQGYSRLLREVPPEEMSALKAHHGLAEIEVTERFLRPADRWPHVDTLTGHFAEPPQDPGETGMPLPNEPRIVWFYATPEDWVIEDVIMVAEGRLEHELVSDPSGGLARDVWRVVEGPYRPSVYGRVGCGEGEFAEFSAERVGAGEEIFTEASRRALVEAVARQVARVASGER